MIIFQLLLAHFVWPHVEKYMYKSHIWPFQTSSGKMLLLCMRNLSTTPSQRTTQGLILISKHKGKCLSSLERNRVPAFENPLGKAEAAVTESCRSRWKGWLIWWCHCVFWRWNIVCNLAAWVKTENFMDVRSRFWVSMHRHECVHILWVVGTQMHARCPPWLRPSVETKKLQECTPCL